VNRHNTSIVKTLSILLCAIATSNAADAILADAASEEYRIQVGDLLEMTVSGAPELSHKSRIDSEGQGAFPLVGRVKAEGIPIISLEQQIRSLVVRNYTPRGAMNDSAYPPMIGPDRIFLEIVEYRPVYTYGDLARSGEQPYRPNMTVRQAIALAGGYAIGARQPGGQVQEVTRLRGEYSILAAQAALQERQCERLQQEIDGSNTNAGAKNDQKPIVAPDLSDELTRLKLADRAEERTLVKAQIAQATSAAELLGQRLSKEWEGTQADEGEYKTAQEAFKRGTIPITRLAETRRSFLLSSSQHLQLTAQMQQQRRDISELENRLLALQTRAKAELVKELIQIKSELVLTREKKRAVVDKLNLAAGSSTQSRADSDVRVKLFRRSAAKTSEAVVTQESVLQPGDVIQVEVKNVQLFRDEGSN
jgi:polysaccharide export outer membrane protein